MNGGDGHAAGRSGDAMPRSHVAFLTSECWTNFVQDCQIIAERSAAVQCQLAADLILSLDARDTATSSPSTEGDQLALVLPDNIPRATSAEKGPEGSTASKGRFNFGASAAFAAASVMMAEPQDSMSSLHAHHGNAAGTQSQQSDYRVFCKSCGGMGCGLCQATVPAMDPDELHQAARDAIEGGVGGMGARPDKANSFKKHSHSVSSLFSMNFNTMLVEPDSRRLTTAEVSHKDSLHEPARPGVVPKFVRSRYFEVMSAAVVALNTFFIWVTTNAAIKIAYSAGNQKLAMLDVDPRSEFSHIVDGCFLAFYTIEIFLRIYAHRIYFLIGSDARWNIVDSVLVIASIVGGVSAYKESGYERHSGIVTVRITRLFKLAKLLRLVRAMRYFKQLQLFVDACLGCVESLFWAVAMIFMVLLLFAIYFVEAFAQWLSTHLMDDPNEDMQVQMTEIVEMYGSVEMAMLTLAKAVSGGTDWNDSFVIVAKTGFFNGAVFVVMVVFFVVAVWNIIASMFIENTIQSASYNRDDAVLAQRKAEVEDAQELIHLCRIADIDKSGTISSVEFKEFMESPLIREFFAVRGLDIKNAACFFDMMASVSQSGEVDLEGFVGSCMRVRGPATSIDLHMLVFENRILAKKTKKSLATLADTLDELFTKLDGLDSKGRTRSVDMASFSGSRQGVAAAGAATGRSLKRIDEAIQKTAAGMARMAAAASCSPENGPVEATIDAFLEGVTLSPAASPGDFKPEKLNEDGADFRTELSAGFRTCPLASNQGVPASAAVQLPAAAMASMRATAGAGYNIGESANLLEPPSVRALHPVGGLPPDSPNSTHSEACYSEAPSFGAFGLGAGGRDFSGANNIRIVADLRGAMGRRHDSRSSIGHLPSPQEADQEQSAESPPSPASQPSTQGFMLQTNADDAAGAQQPKQSPQLGTRQQSEDRQPAASGAPAADTERQPAEKAEVVAARHRSRSSPPLRPAKKGDDPVSERMGDPSGEGETDGKQVAQSEPPSPGGGPVGGPVGRVASFRQTLKTCSSRFGRNGNSGVVPREL
eukprot:TRINITY_DN6474_c0_g2_i2.p1 TRINITY_DN6474_c0_g2~~TRINITY_DN6474_c0_g2_i2.p1  ORF type:complete len:1046 (-),score=215.85 TRINITY_DN6474_c0_g2_i2:77-3214(-)